MDRHPNKVTILAFKDKKLQDKNAEFVLPVNPEQYGQKFAVKYDVKPAQGAQGVEAKFQSSAPEELKLEFVFDGTGTVYGYAQTDKSVPEQIDEFKSVVYDLQGEIHQPRYLKVVWTDFAFDCILTELEITYTLFSSQGTPLRAKLGCTFLNYKETERRVREEGKSSPDLTHVRTVKKGDTLPLMVHNIYGKPGWYLEVARTNGLTNFRRLEVGQDIVLPPVDKSSV
jgi:nucleoid-associated protein YgaU